MPPLISVIIPLFNAEAFIEDAILSILNQTYQNVEIVVVDDGSTDKGFQIVQKFSNIKYFSQTQKGNAAARNQGILMSKGDYIAFLDCDDLYPPEKLSLQQDYFSKNSHSVFVTGLTKEFIQPGVALPNWVRETSLQLAHSGLSPGTWLIKRQIFDQVGLFDSNFTMTSDTEWIVRAKKKGVHHHMLNTVVLHKRIHQKNQSAHATPELRKQYKQELTRLFYKAKKHV